MKGSRIVDLFLSLPGLLPLNEKFIGTPPLWAVSYGLPFAKIAHIHRAGANFEFDQHAPCPGAIRAYAFLAFDSLGEPKDIIAWEPESDRVMTWLGTAWAWGEESLLRPRLGPEVIPIFRSPRSRIRAGLDGLVVIRPRALAYHVLEGPILAAEDARHQAELMRSLEAALPRIIVNKEFGR